MEPGKLILNLHIKINMQGYSRKNYKGNALRGN